MDEDVLLKSCKRRQSYSVHSIIIKLTIAQNQGEPSIILDIGFCQII